MASGDRRNNGVERPHELSIRSQVAEPDLSLELPQLGRLILSFQLANSVHERRLLCFQLDDLFLLRFRPPLFLLLFFLLSLSLRRLPFFELAGPFSSSSFCRRAAFSSSNFFRANSLPCRS
jgi:hypothetical protein